MDELLAKYNDFMDIVDYKFHYHLTSGEVIHFSIGNKDLPHMLGLHKLIDIPILAHFGNYKNKNVDAGYIMKKIRQNRILNDSIIKDSKYFSLIEDRYNNFSKVNILKTVYNEVIIDFDRSKLKTVLKAKYILLDECKHLCIAQDKKQKYYIESFFYNASNRYTKGQHKIAVEKVVIYDREGEMFLEDIFV